jgi:hypothetical protein
LPLSFAKNLQAQFAANEMDLADGEAKVWNNLKARAVPKE